MSTRSPAFQFYPGDYLRDAKLLRVGLEARGLWVAMLCLMHQEGEPYGHLRIGGKDLTAKELARIVGEREGRVRRLLDELEQAQVFSRISDKNEENSETTCEKSEENSEKTSPGTIYSRRMVRDEEIRSRRAAGGIKALDNPHVPRPKASRGGSTEGPPEGPSEGYPSGPSFRGSPSSSVFDLHASSSSSAFEQTDKDKYSSVSVSLDSEFLKVWDLYPRRNGMKVGKIEAYKKWSKLSKSDRSLVLKAIENYATSPDVKAGIGIRDFQRFLLNGHGIEPWREWLEQVALPARNAPGCQFLPNIHIGPGRPKPCGLPVAPQPGEAKPSPYCPEHLEICQPPPEEREEHAAGARGERGEGLKSPWEMDGCQ